MALDALLDPELLVGILDVHVFHTDGAGIGFANAPNDLAQGCRLEAEHIVDEDRPVEIVVREPIRLVIELRVIFAFLKPERIELCDEMTAHAIGTNEHDRAKCVELGAANLGGGRCRSGMAVSLLGALRGLGKAGLDAQLARRPACPTQLALNTAGVVVQAAEELHPARIHARRIFKIAGVKLGDEVGVRAEQEGSSILFEAIAHGVLVVPTDLGVAPPGRPETAFPDRLVLAPRC